MDVLIFIAVMLVIIVYFLFSRFPSKARKAIDEAKQISRELDMERERESIQDECFEGEKFKSVEAAREAIIRMDKMHGVKSKEKDIENLLERYRKEGLLVEGEKEGVKKGAEERLEELKKLYERKLINEEEYNRKKDEILREI